MITKDDWDAALDEWLASERDRLGGPPTPEEVVALKRGELNESEAERVRSLLIYTPELTPLLDDDIEPQREKWRPYLAIAAAVVIAFLAGLLVPELRRSRDPAIREWHDLKATRARGLSGPAIELPHDADEYLLSLTIDATHRRYSSYRIEILDLRKAEPEIVFSAETAEPASGRFAITIPREDLNAGSFRIDVFGSRGDRAELVDSFPFRVPEPTR